eukprot:TRINITY_DN64334_c0_g1_i1.p3 TRINITY_DN64334_c0_g1~~TRINITY_DN64334_c0_g1_i1.p3  ORF type:complete len:111 (-),score=8.76 TRINITY_DN64334_c0_g1_i1:169-501(-)
MVPFLPLEPFSQAVFGLAVGSIHWQHCDFHVQPSLGMQSSLSVRNSHAPFLVALPEQVPPEQKSPVVHFSAKHDPEVVRLAHCSLSPNQYVVVLKAARLEAMLTHRAPSA